MKRIATALTVVCLAFFLSGCGKSRPSGGEDSGDAKVNTAPPTASLGSGSSEPDDGSTNPFEEDDGNTTPANESRPATGKTSKTPAVKKIGSQSPAARDTETGKL